MTISKILRDTFVGEKRFVNWRKVKKGERFTKIPYMINGASASSTDPATWSTYDEVTTALDNGSNHFDGYGIIFKPDQKLVGIDIDHCMKEGRIEHEQKKVIEKLIKEANTYTEVSPSGEGMHLFLLIEEPEGLDTTIHKKAPYEVYTQGRYFTVTENSYGDPKPVRIVNKAEAVRILSIIGMIKEEKKQDTLPVNTLSVLNDEQLLKKMFASKNGGDIEALYNGDISKYKGDDSSADMALCMQLAFWTRKDSTKMESIWLASPLGQRGKTQERKDYVERTITSAISKCDKTYDPYIKENEEESGKFSQADKLLKMITDREDVVLFKDERDAPFISLNINGHREVWGCNSRNLKNLLSHEFYKQNNKVTSSEIIKNVVAVLEGKARFTGNKIKLNNRHAIVNDEIWYDFTNENWQAVKVTNKKWELIDNTPILFKRYSHQSAQVLPASTGDVKLILNHINVTNEKHKILLLVLTVSYFIPDFPHPSLIIFGSQGSAKSTASKLIKKVPDPSLLGVLSLPSKLSELIQTLDHHAFIFFDNVSHISEETSDALCRAITGGGFSKKKLYTDDDDIIYEFKKYIGINGINIVATRPDLLERSVLIELSSIDNTSRRDEKEIYENFDRDLPSILGGIFDTLVKTLVIKPSIKLDKLPRMADFMIWGCAIAESLGYKQEDFIDAYNSNISEQTFVALNGNSVALAVMLLMENIDEWSGTATELLSKLNDIDRFGDHYNDKFFPKAPNRLTEKLNILKVNFKSIGILYESVNDGKVKTITLKRVARSINDGVVNTDGSDDTDDRNQ